jgi:hypothetical protein
MGIFGKSRSSSRGVSSSSYDRTYTAPTTSGNPNPNDYKILKAEEHNGVLVILINYPSCKNYEGSKILVFDRGVTLIDLINQKSIDPHFSNNKQFKSPIARFEPTERGWQWAVSFSKLM